VKPFVAKLCIDVAREKMQHFDYEVSCHSMETLTGSDFVFEDSRKPCPAIPCLGCIVWRRKALNAVLRAYIRILETTVDVVEQ
jgi:hypothetical protein